MPSVMFSDVENTVDEVMEGLKEAHGDERQLRHLLSKWDAPWLVDEMCRLRNPTEKDLMIAIYLKEFRREIDRLSDQRIAPALFFQPHFHNIFYELLANEKGYTVLRSKVVDAIQDARLFRDFKYIKTFTPMRRFTTSAGGTIRFAYRSALEAQEKGEDPRYLPDYVTVNTLNRSFMCDPDARIYHDAIVVRFEDGKLNPKATFTRLAAFLDLPYTESMTYCSDNGERDPLQFATNVRGFDPATVYRTYDDYIGAPERWYMEYFLRDAYEFYGYDFHDYDGAEVDEEKVKEVIGGMKTINAWIRETLKSVLFSQKIGERLTPDDDLTEDQLATLSQMTKEFDNTRLHNARILLRDLRFINGRGQPLRMTPMLEPDPELLEQELYH